ncbi:hypothetical protein GTX53_13295 [Streptomyces sp. SID5594]|nr:hypothetical protein [Streptomyces sp. SID5594]
MPEFGLPGSHHHAHLLTRQVVRPGRVPLLRRPGPRSDRLPWERLCTPAGSLGPVLLMDDCTNSVWTSAVVARLRCRAGAEQVLPLVLAAGG